MKILAGVLEGWEHAVELIRQLVNAVFLASLNRVVEYDNRDDLVTSGLGFDALANDCQGTNNAVWKPKDAVVAPDHLSGLQRLNFMRGHRFGVGHSIPPRVLGQMRGVRYCSPSYPKYTTNQVFCQWNMRQKKRRPALLRAASGCGFSLLLCQLTAWMKSLSVSSSASREVSHSSTSSVASGTEVE